MTTEAVKPLAYGIDSYLEWIKREGLLVHEGLALNLIKLCVGCDSIQELEGWIKQRMKEKRKRGEKLEHIHRTRMAPKRATSRRVTPIESTATVRVHGMNASPVLIAS